MALAKVEATARDWKGEDDVGDTGRERMVWAVLEGNG